MLRVMRFLHVVHAEYRKYTHYMRLCPGLTVAFNVFREALSMLKMFGRMNKRINHVAFKVPFWKILS